MERVILLKTQLAEAAKLAGLDDFAHQRLAVILLDNFMEIQLSTLMKKKFTYDDAFTSNPKKYNYTLRKKILHNYDDLLKICSSENIINQEERDLLNFCHDVRNNLYHHAKEEHLLTTIALQFLHELVLKYQPEWKSARDFTSWTMKTKDPYSSNKEKSFLPDANSKEEWVAFLKTHFGCIPENSKQAPLLITEHLLGKIDKAKDYYQFLLEEYSNFAPQTEHWELNDFLQYYSFYNAKDFELKILKEGNDMNQYNKCYSELMLAYKKSWRFVRPNRLVTLENKIKVVAQLTSHQALEKFKGLRTEIYMIYEALSRAAGDLDAQIDSAIDYQKELLRS